MREIIPPRGVFETSLGLLGAIVNDLCRRLNGEAEGHQHGGGSKQARHHKHYQNRIPRRSHVLISVKPKV